MTTIIIDVADGTTQKVLEAEARAFGGTIKQYEPQGVAGHPTVTIEFPSDDQASGYLKATGYDDDLEVYKAA